MESMMILSFFIGLVFTLFNPLFGLYELLVIAYIRPQDYYPALASMNPARIALTILLISFVLHQTLGGKQFVKAKQNVALLGIFSCILISRLYAIDTLGWQDAAEDFLRICLVYFVIINAVDTHKKLKFFYLFYIFLNLFVALRFYMAYKSGTAVYGISKPGDSSLGFLGNADDLGIGMAIALPFALIPVFYAENVILKGFSAVISGFFMLSALGTDSRGACLGMFTVFVTSIISQLKLEKLRNWKYAAGVILVLFIFSGFIYNYRYALRDSYDSAQDINDPGRVGRNTTWAAAKQMITHNPVLGIGRGNYIAYWMNNYPPGASGYQVAHNIILEVTAELGLVGLLFFLYFSLYGVKEIMTLAKKYKDKLKMDNFFDMIFTIYIIALITFYVNGMFITVAFYWHVYILVAMFVCAKTIFLKKIERENAAEKI